MTVKADVAPLMGLTYLTGLVVSGAVLCGYLGWPGFPLTILTNLIAMAGVGFIEGAVDG